MTLRGDLNISRTHSLAPISHTRVLGPVIQAFSSGVSHSAHPTGCCWAGAAPPRAQLDAVTNPHGIMAELVQLELDEKDKENFAEMQAAMNEAQRELASLTMRGRTRHAEAKCVQRPPMRSRR